MRTSHGERRVLGVGNKGTADNTLPGLAEGLHFDVVGDRKCLSS